ncbi:efflux transporter outer membrane subunit [Sphingomonas sp. HITSZ_GF]|uniref:efflux transporter outer membrane subunit n=1 Tax=Sphingomonas sp. HITSZ_GF TaxID=3037247 RepID=UPI00240DC037|nr:efflux transporter outer membrane subunit [Sphingomonas sp. HITSZ_GF]MDG2535357.1 efflux transporter outer membrane subunit [Sphingomonas sp. HITSZ_GF]
MSPFRTLVLLAGAASLTACNMAPKYVRSVSEFVPPEWPQGAAYAPAQEGAAGMPWRSLVGDDKLRQVIEQALARNQDLAAAVANAEMARAQYRTQRSNQLPTLAASAGATVQRTLTGPQTATTGDTTQFTGNIGVSGFEIDLFGRLKNLSRQALEQYLASDSGTRSTRFTIVAETATAYATLAADQDLLAIARQQVASGEETVRLTNKLHDVGLVSGSDVADAQTILAQAKADVESYTSQVAQDRNALELLAGGKIDDALLPSGLAALDASVANVPAGLSSTVLLDRPDVVEAEHQLKGANANIGAARAAFFPTISLTSLVGVASNALSSLFSGSTTTWSASPSVSLPILGGANRGNLEYAKAQASYYLATYRKTAQTAYKEVADGLARRGTIVRQRAAQDDLVAAADKSWTVADARYKQGIDNFLTALVAQRTLYSARQGAVSLMLTDISNRITLYQAIGSDASL